MAGNSFGKKLEKYAIFLTTTRVTSKSNSYIRIKFDDLAYELYVISIHPIENVVYEKKNS